MKKRKAKGLMGHYQVDQHTYHGNPRGEEREGPESLFEERTTENFPNLRKEMNT